MNDDPTLLCLKNYVNERGYPPSVKELAECLGVGAATAHARLIDLEARGLIVRESGPGRRVARAIRIVEEE